MSGGALRSILGRLLSNLIKIASPILKNVVAPLGLSAAMSGIDGTVLRKIHGGGTTVIFSNEEINILKIVNAMEDSDILMKGSTETLQNDVKKGGALPTLPMLIGTLGVSLLSGKGMYRVQSW